MAYFKNNDLETHLRTQFPDTVRVFEEPYGMLELETDAQTVIELLAFLKDDPALKFNFLTDLTAVHYPEKELEFCVVYHLHSWTNRIRVRVKVYIGGKTPTIPTATTLWEGANWMERETYDFYGIRFAGHPDLRRILNVDDMEAFPMRKEFPLEDPNRVDKKDYFFGR